MATGAVGYALFEKNRLVHVSDGTPIAYAELGHGHRIPVVLANGWSCCDAYWADVAPHLSGLGHKVLLPDNRGHGESGLPRPPGFRARNITRDDVSLERIARDVLEVCDDAEVDEAVFVGHSMGVQTILEVCRQAPERVRGLVAVAGPYENPMKTLYGVGYFDRLFPVGHFAVRLMPELLTPALRAGMKNTRLSYNAAVVLRAATRKLSADRLAPYLAHLATRDPLVLFKMIESMRDHSAADLLPELVTPLLILAGRQDAFTPPATQQKMHELAPGSEIVWFDEAGHCLPLEEPDAVILAIEKFLAKLETTDA